ncbi:hypothetical protein HYFRA_00012449 [Hymenoscyphus fraxineus]|uniref:Zn(2)-C6 fungal-type domain-containing protein n=1 Tax=Hymenoscyphus fraxineus TaxID=746836 RepID=A0A9N9L6J0_9HELO|nr:hypothetical protein HYFRA_00012449 [Hymenoscyphus fraxineus]
MINFSEMTLSDHETRREHQNGRRSMPQKDTNRGDRKQRTAHAKVRTGCVTCKARRVKCDEGVPECKSCLKFGTKCGGYIKNPIRVAKCRTEQTSRNSRLFYRQLLPASPFRSSIDQRYFKYYQEEFAPGTDGTNLMDASDFGTRKTSQAHVGGNWIYDAIIATSALCVAMKGVSTVAELSATTEKESHYATAIRRYDQAITKMRSSLVNGEADIRKAMIGCLLIYDFERLHGNQRLALFHVMGAYKMLQGWMENNPDARLQNGAVCRGGTLVIEEGIVLAFIRIHLQALSVLPTRMTDSRLADTLGNQVFSSMPDRMEDFAQAIRHIVYLLRRVAQYRCFATEVIIANTSSDENDESMAEIFIENPSSDYVACFSTLCIPYACTPTPPDLEELYKRNLEDWNRMWEASKYLFETEEPANTPAAQLLHLSLLHSRINLDSTVFTTECEFDVHEENFRTMIRLIREVVQYGRASKMSITKQTGFKPFAGDLGMLPVLSMVAKFCRNGEIRRDTIELMQMEPRRTGIFDSMLAVNILEWLIEKEEKGADEYGFIPEESRVRILRIDTLDEENCSTGEREVTIVYGMRDGSSGRKVYVGRDVVMWDPDSDSDKCKPGDETPNSIVVRRCSACHDSR